MLIVGHSKALKSRIYYRYVDPWFRVQHTVLLCVCRVRTTLHQKLDDEQKHRIIVCSSGLIVSQANPSVHHFQYLMRDTESDPHQG